MDLEPLFVSTNHIGGATAAAPQAAAPAPQPVRVAPPQPEYASFVAAAG
jgi:hypothetical protein